jgi:hypothetical protein
VCWRVNVVRDEKHFNFHEGIFVLLKIVTAEYIGLLSMRKGYLKSPEKRDLYEMLARSCTRMPGKRLSDVDGGV